MTCPTHWMNRLGMRHPIIQAPMAGTSTPQLAAAVSNAGALGSLGVGHCSVAQAQQQIDDTRALTSAAFNVNVFCHRPAQVEAEREAAWLAYLAPEFARFGATPPAELREVYATAVGNEAVQALLLETRPALVSFHFGVPERSFIQALHKAGVMTLACATTLKEALLIEDMGVELIVAQGVEAGGHRGVFEPSQDRQLGTFALVQLLARHVQRPIIAAGGIMDGRGIAAALQLGASAVQMGTAFIACPESAASAAYRAQLLSARAWHTGVTRAISGRPARGLINRLHTLGQQYAGALPDFSRTYDAGKALHYCAVQQECYDYAAHWAGQGAPLARALPASQLVETLVEEWRSAVAATEANGTEG